MKTLRIIALATLAIAFACLPILLGGCAATDIPIRGQVAYTTARGNTVTLSKDAQGILVGADIKSIATEGGYRK